MFLNFLKNILFPSTNVACARKRGENIVVETFYVISRRLCTIFELGTRSYILAVSYSSSLYLNLKIKNQVGTLSPHCAHGLCFTVCSYL